MQDTEIIKIIFGIFLSAFSITLYIIAFTFFYKYLIQEKKCTSKVIGKVKKYTLATRVKKTLRYVCLLYIMKLTK